MATKTPEELQQLLTETLDIRERLVSSQTTIRDFLRTDQDRLRALSELHCSGRWSPGLVLNGQDLTSVIQCVQYVLGDLQIEVAEQTVEKIQERAGKAGSAPASA